jgi:cysteine desulfurase / selenocysteine lyase
MAVGGLDDKGLKTQLGDFMQMEGFEQLVHEAAETMRSMVRTLGNTPPVGNLTSSFDPSYIDQAEGVATQSLNEFGYYFLREPGGQHAPAQKQTPTPPAHAGGFNVHQVRKDFPVLNQTVHGGKPLIWLDNAATSQKPNQVIDAISDYYRNYNSNIHRAAHEMAARATDAYEGARQKIQAFVGAASPAEIVFVRGTTEALNLIARTYGAKYVQPGDEIIVSESSHHANIVPWQMLANEKGAKLRPIPFNDRGELRIDELERMMNKNVRIVAADHVSNVLGTVNPIKQITKIAHAHGAICVIDGAQSVPHFRPNVQDVDCDFYVFSGHKIFGPTGIGAVYGKMKHLEDMPPYQGGGNMIDKVTFEKTTYNAPPAKFEAGTGHIAGAIGLGAALDYLNRIGFDAADHYERSLLKYGMTELARVPGLKLIGTSENKVSVMSFVIDGIRNDQMGSFLDKEGIAVRSGHHCAQPTLARFGLDSSVRPSLAFYNTKEEVDALLEAVYKAIRTLK